MGRPKGSRAADYDAKRDALARRVFDCIHADAGTSLSAMAEHTGVSRPTLRHYFGDRDGAVRAALEAAAPLGAVHREALLRIPVDDAGACLDEVLHRIVRGLRDFGVLNLHAVGLKVGLEDAATGRTYVRDILEPTLDIVRRVLDRLVDAGRLAPHDTRYGAVGLVSPVVLALLHQQGLDGSAVTTLDVDALARDLVATYCRANGV